MLTGTNASPQGVGTSGENVKVYVRLKPLNVDDENVELSNTRAVVIRSRESVEVTAGSGDVFTYDHVAGEDTEQEEIFEHVGLPLCRRVLQGYNGTVLTYGMTGSGKTHTMQGPLSSGRLDRAKAGLIPRCFEHLFKEMNVKERENANLKYLVKASYLEIYNETIYDLLDPASVPCSLREDIKKGIYVDGITEIPVLDSEDAYRVFETGTANRHVSETAMNRESSRSHSVFTLAISSMMTSNDITDIRISRFALVDLAGSERQKLTSTTGARLKEAANINKSLLSLGKVINALVDVAAGKARHIHYRDSKLTFLLRDSLGGNALTYLIACVNPAMGCYAESLSTLRFARRAKMIQNKAVVNQDVHGSVARLQEEIVRLKNDIAHLKEGRPVSRISSRPDSTLPEDQQADRENLFGLLEQALEKQREAERERGLCAEKVMLLNELLKKKEQQIQSAQMVIRFRESTIKALKSRMSSSTTPDVNDDTVATRLKEEMALLRREIVELHKTYDHHPEVTRFALENLQLREQLERLEEYAIGLAEERSQVAREEEYSASLAARLELLLAERREAGTGQATPVADLASELGIHEKPADFPANGLEDSTCETKNSEVEVRSQEEMDAIRTELEDVRTKLTTTVQERLREKTEYENELRLLEVELKKRMADIEEFTSTVQTLQTENETVVDEGYYLRQQTADLRERLAKETEKAKEKEAELKTSCDRMLELEADLARLRDVLATRKITTEEYTSILGQVSALREELVSKGAHSDQLQAESGDLKESLKKAEERQKTLEANLGAEKASVAELLLKLREERSVQHAQSERLVEAGRKALAVEDALTDARSESEAARRRADSLEASLREKEANLESVRALLIEATQERDDLLEEIRRVRSESTAQLEESDKRCKVIETAGENERTIFEASYEKLSKEKRKLVRKLTMAEEALAEAEINLTERNRKSLGGAAAAAGSVDDSEIDQAIATELQMELKKTKSESHRLHSKVKKLEASLLSSQEDNEELLSQLEQLQGMADQVTELAEAKQQFTELAIELQRVQTDNDKLRQENEKLVSHHNSKQKIQHMVQIKQEANELRKQNASYQTEIQKLTARLQELEGHK